jgi:cobalamin biosynthesis protein CobD/CbiB
MTISEIGSRLLSFLEDSWRFLPWIILGAFLLEWILANAGLPSFWLYRAGRKRRRRPPEPLRPSTAFVLGFLSMFGLFFLLFGAWLLNRFVSFGIQVAVSAFLLEARRLMQIGDDVLYLMQNNRLEAACDQIGRFSNRNTRVMTPYELIGLTAATQRAALPAASIGPLFFMMLGGAPLSLFAKFVLIADWKTSELFSHKRYGGAALLFGIPSELLSKLMLRLSALIMGFRYREMQIRGIRYRLSDLERNGRHIQIASLIMAMLAADILIVVRVLLDQVFY